MKDVSLTPESNLDDIAIIGLAGRFPGAPDVTSFWQAVLEGRDLIRPHDPTTLADNFTDAERAGASYVPVRPPLDNVDMFDAPFFGMLPREADKTDPQFRVFLETCWQALEDAGHDPAREEGAVGVFGGASMSTYFLNNIMTDRARIEDFVSTYQLGDYQQFMGALSDTLATRVAFRLGLTGPAMTVATACSTSLVAVAQACESLRSYRCDMALAGGVSITFPQERGYFYNEGGMVSRDGHCRPFDGEATGTVFGHGAGVVALRRVEDALADGDQIYAVIRGAGINNDGNDKIAFTAPSVTGQAMAIAMAQGDAGVEPGTIGYVECHGTGTPLGDPIEIEGLKKAFAGVDAGRVWIGSSKANIGHCDAAAGVVGLIKTALTLRDRVIPPLANYRSPNPNIDFGATPFRVPTEAQAWSADGPLRAGVSALGVGGTNVHLVLEEAPQPQRQEKAKGQGPFILPISARSDASVVAQASALADALDREDAPDLADVAFTLQSGRKAFDHRCAVVATDHASAVAALRNPGRIGEARTPEPPVAFMFPGQGAQYPGMGQGLFAHDPEFARIIREGGEILAPLIGLDLCELIYGSDDPQVAARVLRDTRITQPALYLVEYATARHWMTRGITPAAMIGHSVGEFVAATMAEVMSFETGLHLIAARGRLMQDQPEGAMLSVRAGLEEVEKHRPEGVDLAARNAPKLTVWAGPVEAVETFAAALDAAGIGNRKLHTSHAFHSAMMDPVVEGLAEEAAKHSFSAPRIPYVSCVTGTWITAGEATDPAYWARHCRAAVDFETAVRALCDAGDPPVLLEVGPGQTLGAFCAQAVGRKERAAILQSLPLHDAADRDRETIAAATGGLWSVGVDVDWSALRTGNERRVSLPGYAFEKSRHWIDAPVPLARRQADAPQSVAASPTAAVSPNDQQMSAAMPTPSRTDTLTRKLLDLLAELSGDSFTPEDASCTFLELGFDSLLLGQVTQRLARDMDVTLTFRQLMTEFPTAEKLVAHLDEVLPAEVAAAPVASPMPETVETSANPMPAQHPVAPVSGDLGAVMQSQTNAMLALFQSQMSALGGQGPAATAPVVALQPVAAPATEAPKPAGRAPVAASENTGPDRHDLNRRAAQTASFDPAQQAFVDDLCAEYSAKFPTSKARAQENRGALADPRTASGFRSEWKELVFPVIAETAHGANLTDPDGNVFLDLVNGFGQTAFGHSPSFVTQAVAAQMEKGFPIGPQTPLAFEVARKFLAITGHERVTFCNTGSEAVMAAMRLARTVTGRDTIVSFKGDYHGQFDEVLVKGRKSGDPTALPAVAGVPAKSVSNMVVLDYGSDAALDWIRENISEIAAVLVEPVQSRRPDHRPRKFCEEVRRITADNGAAMILDEIVTGFRVARGGIQELWNIAPDMATYGKVVGGGMPVGVLSGSSRFLDALDGGFWSFGDDSVPEVPPTFFAGTFVRHPLVLAALSAVLDHIEGEGRALYDRVAPRTEKLLDEMNDILAARGLPRAVTGFSSWLIVNLSGQDPRAALLYPLMRLGGVHVHDGYPWFLTTAHTEADFAKVAEVFAAAIDRLQSVGILVGDSAAVSVAPAAAGPRTMPLTEPQKEVWMAAQLGQAASGVFTESISLHLDGALDVAALQEALNEVIARHDALRLRFAASGEAAEVIPEVRLDLDPEETDAAGLEALVTDDAEAPFDLTQGPLIRARLVRVDADRHVLILTTHHIVCDGWSTYLIVEELAALYNARVEGGSADLPPPASFSAFATGREGQEPSVATTAFWKEQFETPPNLPDLPTDTRRTGPRSFAGATHVHRIGADLSRSLKRAAGREGVTLFAALGGALAAMLGKMAQADAITLAVPTAGQTLLDDDRLVGHCVNLLPIRLVCDMDAPVRSHLKRAAERVLDCFDHGDTTYGAILRHAEIQAEINRQPLTEVQFNLDQQPADFGFSGLTSTLEGNPRAHTNFDLIFNVTESPEGLRIDLTYATDVLCKETVARWCEHFETLLGRIAEDMDVAIGAVPLLDAEEAARIADLGKGPNLSDAPGVLASIAARAAQTPEAVAVEDDTGHLTYAELAGKSDRLAATIRAALPETGQRVAVHLARTVDLPVALLAVMKAGHAYVPLDPNHPAQRNGLVLDTGRVGAILFAGKVPDVATGRGVPCIDIDATGAAAPLDPVAKSAADDTAYVIFTSGSTGVPKGVEVSHGALANFLASMAERPGFGADDVLLSVTTVSFDIAGLELFLPLVAGGRVVIANETDVKEAFPLVPRLSRGDITCLQATPTLWQMLLEAGLQAIPTLKILVGGEPLPRDLADQLLTLGGEVWNMYGPTETTIWSSCGRVDDGRIDIGAPIANTQLQILDAGDQLAPIGVVGELNIGGAGLAKGYFDRADLTAEAFREVDLPGQGATRLFRTGDLALRTADGAIRLLGRRDGQVKLRGFRIELSEVEAAMRGLPGITAAAVDLREGQAGPMLAGFYVSSDEVDPFRIASSLKERLPGYMVPSRYARLDKLPETGNGKLDRRALPDLEPLTTATTARDVTPPQTDLERTLVEIWQDTLGIAPIGTTDDLFDLGVDSLGIFRIAARMLDRDLGIEARHLVQHPNIRDVAAFAETRKNAPKAPSLRDFRKGAQRSTLAETA